MQNNHQNNRSQEFFSIPSEIIQDSRLSPNEFKILTYLFSILENPELVVSLDLKLLPEILNIHKSNIYRNVKSLALKGWLIQLSGPAVQLNLKPKKKMQEELFPIEPQLTTAQKLAKNRKELHNLVIKYFNKVAGTRYQKSENLAARIQEGLKFDDCCLIIDNCLAMQEDSFMRNYFSPNFLFQKSKFEKHLNVKYIPKVSFQDQKQKDHDAWKNYRNNKKHPIKVINEQRKTGNNR